MRSLLLLVALIWAGPAVAAEPAAPEATAPLAMPSDEELAARLGFLEERLDAARPRALAWQYGWTGAYAAGLVSNTVLCRALKRTCAIDRNPPRSAS